VEALVDKPAEIFDRDHEWSELTRFASYSGPEATLGIVSGRRRQGKTFLLDALVDATNGFIFSATETTEADALRQFGDALTAYRREPTPLRFASWDEAITRLMQTAADGPMTVVIDEFPFLAKASPALPSIIQRALDPSAQRTNSPVRLLLCGSALGFMGKLLSGSAPLRGRAGLELVVPTLDFRAAARFWQIEDPRTSLLTNAIVGGTPAYRREFVQGDTPQGPGDFDAWVARAVLNPSRPLFREARYLLAEESDLRDTALYHSVLAAIATGNATRSGVASFLARKSTDLAHPLTVLEDVGIITHEQDAFRKNRSNYRIAEPLITFYHAVMRPNWGRLERPGHAARVWTRIQPTFFSKIAGPHFEQICRDWTCWHADPATLGGHPDLVASGTVNDAELRTTHEVDVAVLGDRGDGRRSVLALGEAKWNTTMTVGHLERMQQIRQVLKGHQVTPADDLTRLILFSGVGFSPELRNAEQRGEVGLVDLGRLYAGS
jgi:AAA+ ATPase superfamily predicted ATPase